MLTGLHLLLTYRCTHECDHCFVYSSPRAAGTFTGENLERVLDQAVELGTVTRIYFEGGEPFLYYPLLLSGIVAARDRGFETGVVTNAFWAETVADAELWLGPFADLQVADLSISDDAFHHGTGDDTPARRALEAARKLDIPCGSISVPQPDEGPGVRYRGRAADTLTAERPHHPWKTMRACPDEELRTPQRVHVDPYGNVHICQGLLLGNVWDTPLARILETYDPDAHAICGPLLRGGPAAIVEELEVAHAAEYASACHLCHGARGRLLDRFPQALGPRQVYGAGSRGADRG